MTTAPDAPARPTGDGTGPDRAATGAHHRAPPDRAPSVSAICAAEPGEVYRVEDQVGFLLRRAQQRHLAIFAGAIGMLTPTQFAALSKLCELGPTSQNALGRATAMDAATIKGVVGRLRSRGLVSLQPAPDDRRRVILAATEAGRAAFDDMLPAARAITAATLAPLGPADRRRLVALLGRIG
jgi:DNA-binding MarR family transcriptional regulator